MAGVLLWDNGTNFVSQIPIFDKRDVGITGHFTYTGEDTYEMDNFMAYFGEPLIEHIVQEKDWWAAVVIEKKDITFSRMQCWMDNIVAEMYVFLSLCMMMKHSLKCVVQDN